MLFRGSYCGVVPVTREERNDPVKPRRFADENLSHWMPKPWRSREGLWNDESGRGRTSFNNNNKHFLQTKTNQIWNEMDQGGRWQQQQQQRCDSIKWNFRPFKFGGRNKNKDERKSAAAQIKLNVLCYTNSFSRKFTQQLTSGQSGAWL